MEISFFEPAANIADAKPAAAQSNSSAEGVEGMDFSMMMETALLGPAGSENMASMDTAKTEGGEKVEADINPGIKVEFEPQAHQTPQPFEALHYETASNVIEGAALDEAAVLDRAAFEKPSEEIPELSSEQEESEGLAGIPFYTLPQVPQQSLQQGHQVSQAPQSDAATIGVSGIEDKIETAPVTAQPNEQNGLMPAYTGKGEINPEKAPALPEPQGNEAAKGLFEIPVKEALGKQAVEVERKTPELEGKMIAAGTPVKTFEQFDHNEPKTEGGIEAEPRVLGPQLSEKEQTTEPDAPEAAAKQEQGVAWHDEMDFNNEAGQNGGERSHAEAGLAHGVGSNHKEAPQVKGYEASTEGAKLKDAKEVYDKFGDGVRLSVSQNGKEVKISLHPEDLGHLHIKLKVEENLVKAHILVDSSHVKGILESDTARLKEVFAGSGLTLDKYSVELNPQSHSNGNSSGNSAWDRGQNSGSRGGGFYRKEEQGELNQYVRQGYNGTKASGGIDVFA